MHPWSLLTITFPNGGRQTQRYFNVSTPSSRRDNETFRHFENISRNVLIL